MTQFDALAPKIPIEEAASFFIKLKTAGKLPPADDALYAQCVKVAACSMSAPAPTPVRPKAPKSAKVAAAEAAFRKAAEDTASDEIDQASSMTSPSAPKPGAGLEQYLAAEAAGRKAEEANASQYYADRFREVAGQMGALQQESAQTGDALAGAQEQIAGHDSALQAAQQEGQLAGQAALAQVQQANAAASEAMQKAIESEGKVIEAKREAVARQSAMQQFVQQLLDIADQAAATAQPVMPSSEAAAVGADPAAMQPAAGVGGAPQAAPADAGMNAEGAPPGEAGAPAAGPEGASAQAAPNSPTPNAGGTAPGDSTPQAKGDGGDQAPEQDSSAKRTGGVHIKVGHPALIGALLGGMAGAGVAGLEAHGHGPDLDALRGRISAGEERMDEPGLGGFAAAFDVAKNKAMLTLGEATQKHPALATITGGLAGAGLGAAAGPEIARGVQEAASHYKG